MLAKIWKKALLAICIIACIYNVMHKLVSRTSLEIQLKSVQNQPSLVNTWTDKNTENQSNEINKNSFETEEADKNDETDNNKVIDDEDRIVVIY